MEENLKYIAELVKVGVGAAVLFTKQYDVKMWREIAERLRFLNYSFNYVIDLTGWPMRDNLILVLEEPIMENTKYMKVYYCLNHTNRIYILVENFITPLYG